MIHGEEAAYVRYMFKEYLAGKNAAELAQEMMDKSRTDPVLQSYQWSYKTIMRLLRNEKYAGDSLHQKTFMTETLPRRCVDNHGELVQYYVSNSHPAIICRADYDAVQCLLSQRKVRRQFSKVQASPFVGKTVCSKCGKGFRFKRVRENGYLVCRSHAENSGDCEMPPIPEKEIRNAFCRMYYNLQKNNCTVLYGMIEELTVARDRQMLWNTDIIALNKEISDINTQSHTLALLNQQGLVDSDIFISQSNQLAQRLRRAKQGKNRIFAMEKDDTIEKTEQILEILETGPSFLDNFDEELLHELVDKVMIDSNIQIRFRLINGLELLETIERTVR